MVGDPYVKCGNLLFFGDHVDIYMLFTQPKLGELTNIRMFITDSKKIVVHIGVLFSLYFNDCFSFRLFSEGEEGVPTGNSNAT